jgi:hypothetical protein
VFTKKKTLILPVVLYGCEKKFLHEGKNWALEDSENRLLRKAGKVAAAFSG